MPYIPSSFTNYRGNILEDVVTILEEDCDYVCRSFEDKDIFFVLCFIGVMALSVLKVICHVFEELQKPKMTYEHLNLERGMRNDCITSIMTRREAIPEVHNHDNLCPNDKVKTRRANEINTLRKYLYEHDLTLNVLVLKKINHRIADEDLLNMCKSGEISKPLYTTHITFGQEINNLLKEVLGASVDLRKNRFTKETYIRVENNDLFPLKDALLDYFNEEITFKFDEDRND